MRFDAEGSVGEAKNEAASAWGSSDSESASDNDGGKVLVTELKEQSPVNGCDIDEWRAELMKGKLNSKCIATMQD